MREPITSIETAQDIAYYLGADSLSEEQLNYLADLIEHYAAEQLYGVCLNGDCEL